MVQLGRRFGQGPASLAEIAAGRGPAAGLPRAARHEPARRRPRHSTRGARGGYELARPPAETKMSEVLRALEGPIAPMFCATEDAEHATICDRTSSCTVNLLWVRVRDAITGALDTMTLADLVPARVAPMPRVATPATPPDRASARHRPEPDPIVTDQAHRPDRATTTSSSAACGSRPTAHPDQEILQGIDLSVGQGEVHAIMGPNGSGKTTLAYALMGHPAYKVTGGAVTWKGRDILDAVARQARPARPVPRVPVPDRHPRPVGRQLHPLGAQCPPPGRRQDRGRSTRRTRPRAASRCATSGT